MPARAIALPPKPSKRQLHSHLASPRPVESRYSLDLVQLFRRIHAEVEKIVEAHLSSGETVERPAPEPPDSVVRHDAPSKGKPVSPSARIAAVGGIMGAKVLGGISDQIRKSGGVAFDRMATAIDKNTGETVPSLIAITPTSADLEDYIDDAREEALDYLEKAGRSYASDVREVLEDSDNFELSVGELMKLIRDRADVSTSKAMFLARDQTLKLHSGIMEQRHKAAGIEKYTWSTSQDERVRPMHADLEDQVFSYDDPPVTNEAGDTNNPGEDYNCFPGDSQIELAYGVTKAYRRRYYGKLTTLVTESGKTIRGTPNHPVLTRRGWIALGDLNLSDEVLEVAEEVLSSAKTDNNDRIASISDVFASLQELGVTQTARSKPADFHGDGSNDDVDVVLAAVPLSFGQLSRLPESTEDLDLSNPNAPRFSGGPSREILFGSPRSLRGTIGGSGCTLPLLESGSIEPEDVSFASSADREAGSNESRFENLPREPGALLNRQQTFASSVGDYTRLQFVKVRNVWASGALPHGEIVYNLETAYGWYVSQGILAHNCRCVAIPYLEEPDEESEPDEDDDESTDE